MNRKQFLWLMLAFVLLGGASLALFWQDITAYRDSGAKIGARLMPELKISDVAKLRLQDAQQDRFHVVGHVQLPPGRGESPQNKRASRPNGHTRGTDSSGNDRWSGSCPSCGLDLAGRARECQRESHSGFRLSLARSFAADPGRAAFRPGVASVAQFAQSAFSRWIQFRG